MSLARIVVIEDNPADIRLLRHALDQHQEPYELDVLRDGEEAIRYVREASTVKEPEPCVVVLDVHLPRYDGTAVLRAIREEPALEHAGIVVLTTIASPREELALRNLGVHLYARKPSELDAWVDLAGRILAICHEHSELRVA